MLSTFVIGLREGLEAALIVGIVAAFLKQRGRRDLLRLVWAGVALAVLICLGVGLGLHAYSAELPQKQQEGLETVVGVIAVAMVTYMVVWMRRHSRELKQQLEGAASSALESGSGWALVAMAFLAVFREGFETAVFLLAAFNEAANPATAGAGAVLGVLVALGLGYGIYRGGVRINLSKFFRATGAVLVLVAAGLVVNALHTAHEAGWLTVGQGPTLDLSWLVRPGSVQSSLLTGMLGWQPQPVIIELAGWLLYLIPVGLYVLWPPGRSLSRPVALRVASGVAVAGVVAGTLLYALASSATAPPTSIALATSGGGSATVRQVTRDDSRLVVATSDRLPAQTWTLRGSGRSTLDGRAVQRYSVAGVAQSDPRLPARVSIEQLAALAGGRLPLGVSAGSEAATVPVRYTTSAGLAVSVDTATGRVLDVAYARTTTAVATLSHGPTSLGTVRSDSVSATPAAVSAAANAASADTASARSRSSRHDLGVMAWAVAAGATVVAAFLAVRRRPRMSSASLVTSTAAPAVSTTSSSTATSTAVSSSPVSSSQPRRPGALSSPCGRLREIRVAWPNHRSIVQENCVLSARICLFDRGLSRSIAALVACAVAAVTLAACSSSSDTSKSNAGKTAGTSSTSASGGAPSTSRQVNVALTAKGCAPEHTAYASGPLTFVVKNTDATAVSEIEVLSQDRILGEKENLAPGFSATFSIELGAGKYTVYCPGADTEKNTLTITGTAAPVAGTTHGLLVQGADEYLSYARAQVSGLTSTVATLNRAVQGGNLKAAQVAYARARPYYERIEPVAESFPALDAAIDLRADSTPISRLTGFHRLEYGLFTKKSTTGLAPISTGLVGNVKKLATLVAKLTGFQPAELANGAVSLLDEAANKKITGEEERYSHIDMVDLAANVEGSQQAFAFLEPGLTRIDPVLTKRIRTAFAAAQKLVLAQRDPAQPSGYRLYPTVPKADITAISHALLAVSEPLSTVAGKVVTA